MKEREDKIMRDIKDMQKFNALVNKVFSRELTHGEDTIHVSAVKFTFFVGEGGCVVSVNGSMDNVIWITNEPKQIRVIDKDIPGKEVLYHIRYDSEVSDTITNDILKSIVTSIL